MINIFGWKPYDKHGNPKFACVDTSAENPDMDISDLTQQDINKIEQELKLRKSNPIEPIYTTGGHGYEDDDDEDFWCPICHEHLGTHHGWDETCSLCGQTIKQSFDNRYTFEQMASSSLHYTWKTINQI